MVASLWSDPALITTIGVAAGSLTTGCLIPQAVRTHRTRSAGDLSLVYLTAMDAGVLLWIVYGFCLGSSPVVVANVVSAVLVTDLVILRLRHGMAASEARTGSESDL